MAPRKRTTNKSRKNGPKMAKLEAFLDDFDSEVKTNVERMKESTNCILKDADNFYNMALIKLSKAVRQMNWIELCESEKEKEKTPEEDAKKEEVAAQVESVMAEVHAIPPKSAKKLVPKRNGVGAASEDEENVSQNQATVKKGKTTKKVPSTSKRAKAISVSKQNASIRKSNRKPLITPARNLDSSLMGPTPLFTPRFDSRLPKTPAVRVPRHKERVYSISVNGSPIAGGVDDIVLNIPSGNGECLQLLASEMESVDLTQLDDTTLQSIRLLQNRLTTLCGQPK
ncbi:borealin [Conger conger]|uniref:borealin n=1 Tax=Conger conger TaxID=82655 RepID=UPI002A5ACC01|nr:borealin [Conger conger]XP_061109965.1 borealin [Conger conger]